MYNMRLVYNWKLVADIRKHRLLFEKCFSTFCNDINAKSLTRSTKQFKQHCRRICILDTPKSSEKCTLLCHSFILRSQMHTSGIALECIKSSEDAHNHNSCHRHCWNCGRDTNPERELFFCDCGVVQRPANELTFFDLMQLKPSFDIDTKKLGDIFKETQMKLHPDKFSGRTQEERDLAQHQSALLNRAYNTILKPLSRAIYLLSLQNIEISEKEQVTEPELLMEIMEINEQISSAKQPSDVEALETINYAKIAKCVKDISDFYNRNLINDMKTATIQLRYYTTIQERINEVKRSNMG